MAPDDFVAGDCWVVVAALGAAPGRAGCGQHGCRAAGREWPDARGPAVAVV